MKLSLNGLTISEVSSAHAILLEALGEWNDQESLDLSDIHAIDMCGIQLLLSFHKSLDVLGYPLKLSGMSDYLKSSFILSGCAEALGIAHE